MHYLQHVEFEGLGLIEQWLTAHGHTLSGSRLYAGDALPELESVDLLIIMGGPMSVNDEQALPWLREEKAFIRRALTADKAMLGICLGAQLIAAALGQPVYANAEREIGWFRVTGNTHHNGAAFHFPAQFHALHWHGETFDLPPGAILLASSDACENQAFQLGRSVIGLQFHLEADRALLERFVTADAQALSPERWVQTAGQILSVDDMTLTRSAALLDHVLTYLTEAV
ncbi:type 1 glutamine amidotransferase [Halopseudomonas aestusnigri]|uniref:type 1 glutamine amidotransferase n=1 Tax=Halopseudomonas TaxID=2901189 RepID=UPI001D189638|nr:type 1 glutamine amidotransferase [Halopseudomonas aestusnigri]MCC4259143.1 type 1 glutamine amidotransferase [Halopseudomonas aestusnigri]UGV32280.1 type 1 glutamine amidotransferase [Halopseudomonas aestusnigri]